MRFNSVIYLIPVAKSKNSIGDGLKIEGDKRKTFAKKKSVRQSEFYQATATGFKPDITFVIWAREYKGETYLEYNNKKYSIIRTFEVGEKLELICEGVINSGTT